MAILTFSQGESFLEGFGSGNKLLHYKDAFNLDKGWIAAGEAANRIQQIRDIKPEEAAALASFLMEGLCLSEFRSRTSPEDFAVLLDAVVTENAEQEAEVV